MVRHLVGQGAARPAEIAAAAGLSIGRVDEAIEALVGEGLVVRSGPDLISLPGPGLGR